MTDALRRDLTAHGIDPEAVTVTNERTWLGNGCPLVVTLGKRRAELWFGDTWTLKISRRYVKDAEGWPAPYPSAGAALSAVVPGGGAPIG